MSTLYSWLWGAAVVGWASPLLAIEPPLPPRPNVVVLLCDDLGYGDLGCYGHPVIQTPHLDKLAEQGYRLTDCYSAAPVCSPSRVGLLTGRSPNRAGVYDWIPPAGPPRPDQRHQVHLRKGEATIATQLKKAGYATCLAGKWHCNSRFNSKEQPQPGDFGFDHWLATQNNAAPSHRHPKNFVRNGKPVGEMEGYSCQLVVTEAIDWLQARQAKKEKQPFFLFLPFHEPHEPVASPPDLVAKYLPKAKNEDEAHYFANVENVDSAVGRLIAQLEKLSLRENTLIVFTSDNGPETLKRYRGAGRSYGRPGPLRGMKLWTTDAGFRVAGIMNWPQRLKPGVSSSEVVSALDLLPTLCALAGAPLPSRPLDGVDLSAWINGKPLVRPQPLLWCYYNSINEQRVAMRDGPWKLLARLDGAKLPKMQNLHSANHSQVMSAALTDFELYRITDDINESRNRLNDDPATSARLQSLMVKHYRDLLKDSHIWQP